MSGSQSVRLLLVENDEEQARRVIQLLRMARKQRFRWLHAKALRDAQEHLEAGGTDVALLDLCLPDARGLDVLRRAQRSAPDTPLIVLSSQANEELATQALQYGAQDFLLKRELTHHRLVRAVSYAMARHQAQSSLRALSLIDELTGLHNRRGFIALAEQQLKSSTRRGLHSSLVFVDVDQLKEINDQFGHREGDRALQEVADVIRECSLRDCDIIARLGGDEFCALLPDTSDSGEALMRDRLARAFEARNARPGCCFPLSVSVGMIAAAGQDLEHQLAIADAQMYAHKREKHASRAGSSQRSAV